ncbi:methyltransferase [Paenibacillus marinisediminis]
MSSPPAPGSGSNSGYRMFTAHMERIMDPNHPLCRDDIIWLLNTIKNKLTEEGAHSSLTNEVLLDSYRYYAELSMLMLQRNSTSGQESERLRRYMKRTASILLKPSDDAST